MIIESATEHMAREHETQNFTKNGECSQCGECCSRLLPLTDKEKRQIHKYIKAHNIKESVEMVPFAKPGIDMTCPFLDKHKPNKKCRIYAIRPGICRSYRCDKTVFDFEADGYLLDEPRKLTDMRAEFYGR